MSQYTTKAVTGRHVVLGDLMPQAGGNDQGPSPKEYLLAALGSCTVMTMNIYANAMIEKGKFPKDTIIRRLAVRCEEIEGDDKHIPEAVKVIINIDTNLDKAAKARLLAGNLYD